MVIYMVKERESIVTPNFVRLNDNVVFSKLSFDKDVLRKAVCWIWQCQATYIAFVGQVNDLENVSVECEYGSHINNIFLASVPGRVYMQQEYGLR